MKKIVSILLLWVVLLSSVFVSYADDVTVEDKRQYLVDLGLPVGLIAFREDVEISEMYSAMVDRTVKYLGTEFISMTENYEMSDIVPYGTIPGEDMTLAISTVADTTYDSTCKLDKVNKIYVYIDYVWAEGHPSIRKEDAIAVNWDYSVFTLKADSFVARDYRKNQIGGSWVNWKIYTSPEQADQGGLGYITALSSDTTAIKAKQLKGSAQFELLPKNSPIYLKSGSSVTSINVQYTHNKNILPFPVGFQSSSGFGITVDLAGSKDSVAKTTNFYYCK